MSRGSRKDPAEDPAENLTSCFSVAQAANEYPHRIAIMTPSEELSWRELALRVDRLRSELDLQTPDWRDQRIGLLGRLDLASLVALYLLLEEGVPFLSLHPRLTESERQKLCVRFGIQRVWPGRQEIVLDSGVQRAGPPAGTLAVLFTSGTSGEPKGAILSRAAMLASAEASARNLGWEQADRWLLSLPIAHVGGLSIVTRCLAARATVVLQEKRAFAPEQLVATIEAQQVTLLSLVPTMLKRLLDWASLSGAGCPRSVRAVLVGGAAASEALLRQAVEQGWPVLTTYGLTEACSQVATQDYALRHQVQSGVGQLVQGLELRLADESMSRHPAGTDGDGARRVGRIQLRGSSMFSGYLGQPSPFDQDGFFDTGDSGFVDASGCLNVVGRRSDLIVSGGENVYPVEVEAVLESHPDIAAAAVFGIADQEWGQQVGAALVAVDRQLDDQELIGFLKQRLAGFKRPRRVVWVDELPLNRSSKIDRSRAAALGARASRLIG